MYSKLNLTPFVLLKRIDFDKPENVANNSIKIESCEIANTLKPKLKLKCYFCDKIFPRSINVAHLHTHTKEEPYKCGICKERFKTNHNLKLHIQTIHKQLKIICPHCKHTFSTKGSLKRHIQYLHNQNGATHECQNCQKSFTSNSDMTRHILRIHDRIKNILCTFCPQHFYSKSELNLHMNSAHFRQKDLTKCSEPGCNLMFNHYSAAWQHRIKCHPRDHEVDKLKCKICNKLFAATTSLRAHEKNVHTINNPRVKCPLCPETYSKSTYLLLHITSQHTAEKSFRCDRLACQKEFALQRQLSEHKKRHLDNELGLKYNCDKCSRVFNHKKAMQQHSRKNH